MTISVKTITPFGNRIFVKIISGGGRTLGPVGGYSIFSMLELSLNLQDNRHWSGTRLSAPASGYFSSNLLPNATITLIYGSSHPYNGSLSKSAHLQRQGPERKSWLWSIEGLIDLETTCLVTWLATGSKLDKLTDKTEIKSLQCPSQTSQGNK